MINAAVLGSPIAHSLSPLLHSVAYEYLDLDGNYEAIEVGSGDLADFLASTDKNCLSLTMPLKEEALYLAHDSSELSKRISSGNTLVFKSDRWHLTTTDVAGFEFSLKSQNINKLDSVLILGAGATARAAISYLSSISQRIQVVSRNVVREAKMNLASNIGVEYLPWEPTQRINEVDLVVNTAPGDAADLFLPTIDSPRGTLFEVLYHPWPTPISRSWSLSENKVIDGLELLIHQAISQIELFSGIEIDREQLHATMREAALQKLR